MTEQEFYGEDWERLENAKGFVLERIEAYRLICGRSNGENPIEYCSSRIKNPDSMIQKLQKNHLPADRKSALTHLTDAVGIRLICSFVDGVYQAAEWIRKQKDWEIARVKDYISCPKPNGYRSFHMILRLLAGNASGIYVEVQIRTIAIDCWASLEHQLKYKKKIHHQKLIVSELKRCADEIASVDYSLQTIKDLIDAEE